ncbi:hypothetical protein SeMB42_g05417 [Synchytrium endobioticum]|uniref:Protein kinase domain-containing protein n=1 Tax=Synchytrium endobioticum TaxID=286115 RepID=A0A507CNT2_9FUNG|nr:hypothetical protein SeLEV6574_g06411 [Synchytrium endobioticum]TPX41780.1 hypothetical protein SeMB42_g05417 [Synchytrium endobioticum]
MLGQESFAIPMPLNRAASDGYLQISKSRFRERQPSVHSTASSTTTDEAYSTPEESFNGSPPSPHLTIYLQSSASPILQRKLFTDHFAHPDDDCSDCDDRQSRDFHLDPPRPSHRQKFLLYTQQQRTNSYLSLLAHDRGYQSDGSATPSQRLSVLSQQVHADNHCNNILRDPNQVVLIHNNRVPSPVSATSTLAPTTAGTSLDVSFPPSPKAHRTRNEELSFALFSSDDPPTPDSECPSTNTMNFPLTPSSPGPSSTPSAVSRASFTNIPSTLARSASSSTITTTSSVKEQRDRAEWVAMLSSVLSGEVVASEKVRLSTWLKSNDQLHIADDRNLLWLSIIAHLSKRNVDEERVKLDEKRAMVEKVLQDVMDFTIIQGTTSMYDQVATLLASVDRMESLYPSRHALIAQHPQYGSEALQYRLDALISWITISKSIRIKLAVIKQWTGCDLMEGSFEGENRLNRTEFVNMMLKDAAVKKVFTTGVLKTSNFLLNKAKNVMVEYTQVFKRLGLYMFTNELERLAAFPSDLMLEFLKARLAYGDALANLAGMVADQVIDDIGENLQLAISILQEAVKFYQPSNWWSPVNRLSSNYESHLLGTLKLYLKLLAVRTERSAESMLLPVAEQLEAQWDFAKTICHGIRGGAMECAVQFCTLEIQLLHYAVKQVEVAANRVGVNTGSSLKRVVKAHHRLLDDMRTSVWTVVRLLRLLSASISNSVEFEVLSHHYLINQLVLTGHALVQFTGISQSITDMVVFASPNTESGTTVANILDWCVADPAAEERPNEFGHYVVVLPISPQLLDWTGRLLSVVSYEVPETLLRAGHALVVAEGVGHVEDSRLRFENTAGESAVVCSEPRPFHCRPQQELRECRRALIKLLDRFKLVTGQLREQLRSLVASENTAVLPLHTNSRSFASDAIGDWFCFVAELGHKALRSMTYSKSSVTRALTSLLVELIGDWVDFCLRDCDSKSRRTLRWCLQALEFAEIVVATGRIDTLRGIEFSQLKASVARGMSLLIRHIDVQGLRFRVGANVIFDHRHNHGLDSPATLSADTPILPVNDFALESSSDDYLFESQRVIKTFDLDTSPSRKLTKSYTEILAKVEEQRERRESSWRLIGKVLDDASSERDRALKQILSDCPQFAVNWQQGKFLGGGSYGTVSVAINLDTSDLMAVKEIRFSDSKSLSTLEKSVREEMAVLRQLSHPNTVEYYGVEVRRDRLYIFMEYCPQSLSALLDHGRIEDERVLRVFVKQMLRGLEYLHSKGIVHRDIKPANLLIGSDGQIKYVDFGASKIYKSTKTIQNNSGNSSLVGTANYLAPEVITGDAAGIMGAQDIWSLGCCVLEMVTGQKPWNSLDNDWAVMYHIGISNCSPALPGPEVASRDCRDFLMKCFGRPASARPTAAQLMQHPWVANIDEEEYEITMTPTARAVSDSDDMGIIRGFSHRSSANVSITSSIEGPNHGGSGSHQRPPLFRNYPRRPSILFDDETPTTEIRGKKQPSSPLYNQTFEESFSDYESNRRFKKRVAQSLSLPVRAESILTSPTRGDSPSAANGSPKYQGNEKSPQSSNKRDHGNSRNTASPLYNSTSYEN